MRFVTRRLVIVCLRVMAIVALVGASAYSCLLVGEPLLTSDAYKAEGSCMCAICWDQQFCLNSADQAEDWYLPVNGMCPNGGILASPASRVVSSINREGNFFCVTPENGDVNVPGLGCPANRQTIEHIEPCLDLPGCAQPPECGAGGGVACPEEEQDPRPTVCADVPNYDPDADWKATRAQGAQAAVDALVQACSKHGEPVPTAQPKRYCFLACVATETCELGVPEPWCDGCSNGTSTQALAQVYTAFPVDVQQSLGSIVDVSIKDEEGNFQYLGSLPVDGSFRLSIPEACHGGVGVNASCPAAVKNLLLFSNGTITAGDEQITNIRMTDDAPFADLMSTAGLTSQMEVNTSPRFGVTADTTSQNASFETLASNGPLVVNIAWAVGQATLTASLLSTDGQVAISFTIVGQFNSLPPVAVAKANSPVECGIDPIALDGISSHDPDGQADIVSYNWASDLGEAGLWSARGMITSLWHRKPGQYRFYLTASDSVSSRSTDYVDVELVDSLPPVLDVGSDIFVETCEPIPPPLFDGTLEDDCDTEPTLDIKVIEVNGVETSIPFVPGETRLPFGKSILLYTAYDDSGNSASGQHAVFVEKGHACCAPGATKLFGTAGNDVLTNASGATCVLGMEGDDTLTTAMAPVDFFGGLGDDEVHDNNGNLLVAWGGNGHDDFYVSGNGLTSELLISGGPGTDVVIFSGSRPVRLRGGAGIDDLNSSTGQVTTFVVGAPCEVVAGEAWNSSGPTVIESPVSLTELKERGLVTSLGTPVTYVPTSILPDAECF